ncbi:MAG: hypothetical protein QGH66_09550 [Dehalococcoidia bacterium]|nr:hypothetical protein [Dehalococcoidia bacterium]MDP7240499.1 hypothetical protein [Dehalococcoidia bacterium]
MLAQFTFTPNESKKFIALSVMQSDLMKRAAAHGTVAIHPSSSTYFIAEALLGAKPPSNTWVCGVIVPKGTCVEAGATSGATAVASSERPGDSAATHNPGAFKNTYVIRQGQFSIGAPLDDILSELGPDDVYIKGVNAVDPQGNVAVLIGNMVEGGTIGRVLAASRRQGFTVLCPVGLEKLIPVPVSDAAKMANRKGYVYSMGMPCSLLPCVGDTIKVVTETSAITMLSGASVMPIAAGGLGGAEGAVTLAVQGEESQLGKVVEMAEASKGAQLPDVRVNSCFDCTVSWCAFPVGTKPWVVM